MRLELIDDVGRFHALREEWNALLERSAADCLFLTWEWLYTWWKHLAAGRRLHLLVVRDGDGLAAIAPLTRRPAALGRLLPFPALEFLGTGNVGSDYLDVILRRGKERDAVETLAGALADAPPALELTRVNRETSSSTELARTLRQQGWRIRETTLDPCPFINLDGQTWESYLATQGPTHFPKRLKGLQRRFDVRFSRVESEGERREALEVLVALHTRRWQGRGGSEVFVTPGLRSFYEEVTRLALERGWLRLFTLRLDGSPAAVLLGYRYGPTFYFYQSGFQPAFARESVGFLIIGMTIRYAIEEGASVYDFMRGAEVYKSRWARDVRTLAHLDLFAPGGRGVACWSIAAISRPIRRGARAVVGDALAERIASRGWRGVLTS